MQNKVGNLSFSLPLSLPPLPISHRPTRAKTFAHAELGRLNFELEWGDAAGVLILLARFERLGIRKGAKPEVKKNRKNKNRGGGMRKERGLKKQDSEEKKHNERTKNTIKLFKKSQRLFLGTYSKLLPAMIS